MPNLYTYIVGLLELLIPQVFYGSYASHLGIFFRNISLLWREVYWFSGIGLVRSLVLGG